MISNKQGGIAVDILSSCALLLCCSATGGADGGSGAGLQSSLQATAVCPGSLLLRLAREAVAAGLVLRNVHPRNLLLAPPPASPVVAAEWSGYTAVPAGEGSREGQQQQAEAGKGKANEGDGTWGLRMVDVGCDWTPADDPRDTARWVDGLWDLHCPHDQRSTPA